MADNKGYRYGELQKGILNKLIKDLTNFKKAPKERKGKTYASGRLGKLEEEMVASKNYHEAIIGGGLLEENLKKDELLVVYEQIYEIYLEYHAELVEAIERATPIISAATNTGVPPCITSVQLSQSAIRLPRIDIPKFGGTYTNWRAFYDRFQALVHNNKSLEDIDKLHFLQSCLVGDANRFLQNLSQNLSVEAASYESAWELLKQRYDHKRILVHLQMQNLFDQPAMNRETASGLRDLLYTTRECFLALENMDVPVISWDTVLIWFLYKKLPSTSQKLWEEKLGNRKDLSSFKEFTDFLETRFRTLEVVGQQEQEAAFRNKEDPHVNTKPRFPVAKPKVLYTKQVTNQPFKPPVRTNRVEQLACELCNQDKHTLRKCQRFLNMDNRERRETVRRLMIYEYCLSYGHLLQDCLSLNSFFFFQQRHHSLLHTNFQQTSNTPYQPLASTSAQSRNPTPNVYQASVNPHASEFQPMEQQQQLQSTNAQNLNYHASHGDRNFTQQVLLATAVVKARAADGRLRLLRPLIDTGSETSFITEAAAQLLKLEKRCKIGEISGLGLVSSGTSQHSVEVRFAFRHSTFETAVQALVFKSLTGHLPVHRVIPGNWKHLMGLSLADPHLYEPAPIDLLLGSDVCVQILLPDRTYCAEYAARVDRFRESSRGNSPASL